ncbi:MAG: hypothetical protein JHD16_15565, partial [Solirubrobacteraceae bacterium]|nr:hypothetical protein [Solirubrobacteraceae bacterium]
SYGSYASPQAYTDGVSAALPVAVGVLVLGTIAAALLPSRKAFAAQVAAAAESHDKSGESSPSLDATDPAADDRLGRQAEPAAPVGVA